MTGELARVLEGGLRRARGPIRGIGSEDAEPESLLAEAARFEEGFRSAGITPDEPVLVGIRNRPADLAALLGIWRAGGVAVPVHEAAAAATWRTVQAASGARFSLRSEGLEGGAAIAPPAPRLLLRGAALVVFTSGSTGTPKGVAVGHDGLAGKLGVLHRLLGFSPGDTVVVPLQLTFIFGFWVSLLALRSGARLALVSRFSAESTATAFAKGGTVLAAVPTMLRTILAAGSRAAPDLRLILTGGEVLGPALGRAIAAEYPEAGIFDLYGSTETGSCDFQLGPEDFGDGLGTIGAPTEGVSFRIAGDNGPVPDGGTGELQIRTPFGMLGYLDRPDLTAASYVEGYFRTGDLARVRRDGRVELVGRAKEMISRGGNKIAPLEIDHLLCSHPGVAAALCAGVPDERLGEAIHAAIVPKPGTGLLPEEVRSWLAARTERFKIPDVIEIVDALPVGPTGKASRAALVDTVGRKRGAG